MLGSYKKIIQSVMLCLIIIPLAIFSQPPIVWLPSASDSLQAVTSSIEPSLKRQIVSSLYQSGILSAARMRYREVKIKVCNTALRPYAIAFLYSNTFLKFHVVRLDLDNNGDVTSVYPHYHLKRNDLLLLPQPITACQNQNIKALLFLPAYMNMPGYVPCSKPDRKSVV